MFVTKNRTIFDTIESILKSTSSPSTKSEVYRITGVRWDKMDECLKRLFENGLLDRFINDFDHICFQTTKLGLEYLEYCSQIKKLINYKNIRGIDRNRIVR